MDEALGWVFLRLACLALDILNLSTIILCDLPKLMKHGPRYWRVTRNMRRRAYLQKLG